MCRSALDDLSGPEPRDDDWMTSEVQWQEATAAVVMAEALSEKGRTVKQKERSASGRRIKARNPKSNALINQQKGLNPASSSFSPFKPLLM
ncbi:hypothetical protein CK203_105657 [Vitis vinifera]|uniref:Uncharacterized protein n=1 Tax=Vitis vinifera TaxID=29760 RepID=A0A438CH48_VITVI|nr:hypothetical protein CK203_105657 [Vitis vinifera]